MTQDSFENKDIEKLAAMVGREFTSLRTEMENRFEAVDARFESLEAEIHNGFRSVNERINKLQEIQIPLPEQDELWQGCTASKVSLASRTSSRPPSAPSFR